MSSRSFPEGFERAPREIPLETRARHESMMQRLAQRCAEVAARQASQAMDRRGSDVSAPAQCEPITASAGGETSSVGLPSGGPPLSRSALEWLPRQGEARKTACGRYVVARVTVMRETRYELRTQRQEGSWELLDGHCADFEVAKLLAQRHADCVPK
jgi:hypothetical protein